MSLHNIKHIDPGVKAIVCSGYSTDPVMARYSDYGFKASISKPFTIGQLGKVLQNVLSES